MSARFFLDNEQVSPGTFFMALTVLACASRSNMAWTGDLVQMTGLATLKPFDMQAGMVGFGGLLTRTPGVLQDHLNAAYEELHAAAVERAEDDPDFAEALRAGEMKPRIAVDDVAPAEPVMLDVPGGDE